MLQLWTAIPLGDLASGAGYMLRLTREGNKIMEGDRGLSERVRLCTRLVQAQALLGRPCVVHAFALGRSQSNTVGTPPSALLRRARKWENPAAGSFGHDPSL